MDMKVLTFDVETTHVNKPNSGTTPLPYFGNRLVSLGYKWLDNSEVRYLCFHHSEKPADTGAAQEFQEVLTQADVVVGQNIKFDLQWIRSCGFTYDGDIYDTMVAEYILAKARRWPLGLASLAEKYGGVQKATDLTKPYLDSGKTFYDIPWDIIEEYGTADVLATENVALKQLEAFGTTFKELFHATETITHTETVTGNGGHAVTH